jgi:SAM-dependent methyltransferase
MLTLTQVELVQSTFAIIAPIADDAAALFYRRLFEIDPSLQLMFKDDMADQRRKLMHMLTAAVIHFRQHVAGVPGGRNHEERLFQGRSRVPDGRGRRHEAMSDGYFIGVNAAEIDRLRTQHEAWRPETQLLWEEAGFGTLTSIADFGCGPGFTSLDLARMVKDPGEICAIDKARGYLDYLADQARAQSIVNVSALNADATKPGSIPGRFDGAFCRWFLAFLIDDLDVVLRNVRDCLRPGGRFAAMEYLTLRSVTSSPSSAPFDAHTRAWIEFYARHGGDTSVGASLAQRLRNAGFKVRSLKCVGGMANPNHRWWEWWGRLIRDFGPKFVETDLLSSSEWEMLQRDWAALSQQPHAFIYTPVLLQVIAERE